MPIPRLLTIATVAISLAAWFSSSAVGICPDFRTAETYSSGGLNPSGIVVGDFNRDGKDDIAVTNSASNDISILLANGDGSFAAPLKIAVGTKPVFVAAADFNNDNKLDLAVANSGSNDIAILLGNGDGTFSSSVSYAVGSQPVAIATSDFNNDGRPDVVVANLLSENLSVLLANGDGTFATPANVPLGGFGLIRFVAAGDFTGDGKSDVAVIGSNALPAILLGNGDGTFRLGGRFSAGIEPSFVLVADFNGDRKLDMAVANR